MRNYIYQKVKEVAFLLAGALIGVIFTFYGKEVSQYLKWFIVAIFILILFGIGGLEGICKFCIWLNRKINNFRKKACIYAPYAVDGDTSSWIGVSLRQLEQKMKETKIRYCVKKTEKAIKKFPIVVNPYGGAYPENNVSVLQSLNNIFDYVRSGGIYVNIADIPFYYAYDQNLGRRVDTTPLAGDFSQVRSFLQTILTRKLHCFVYALIGGEYFDNGITRIIEMPDNAVNFFDKEIPVDESDKKFSPFLAISYGRGYFVFSTMKIEKFNTNKIVKIIEKSLELL